MADGEFVTYRWAFTSACPFCRHVMLLTPDPHEAEEAKRLNVPDPASYSEPVPTGGGTNVHFIRCAGCQKMYVSRRGPRASDLQKVKNWELRMASRTDAASFIDDPRARTQARKSEESNPQNSPPKVHLDWQGISFDVWMREVMSNPNHFIRQKIVRECQSRGLILPWESVGSSA